VSCSFILAVAGVASNLHAYVVLCGACALLVV